MNLFDQLRNDKNLFSAWRHVKKSALSSKNFEIRGKASDFEHQHQRHIRRIQTQLREGRFVFDGVEGVLKDKNKRIAQGKAPRPIAIGSIQNRIVERAILQVLQPRKIIDSKNIHSKFKVLEDERIGKLNLVNTSLYGVGGLMKPYGGVQPAIKFILTAIENGAKYYYQSDIKSFYTKIPTENVVKIVRSETGDHDLADLFARALDINLLNEDELLTYAKIFPRNGVGVAQGSSLSAFAGNVLLYDFDHKLNENGISCVRYIDDLVILSSSKLALKNGVRLAKQDLKSFGFDLYPPSEDSEKASEGECRNGISFLGCMMKPNRCIPSKPSIDKVDGEIGEIISDSKNHINYFLNSGKEFNLKFSRCETISKIGNKLYGWEKSFSFCTDVEVFRNLDNKIRKRVLEYDFWVYRKTKGINENKMDMKLQIMGIPNLSNLYLRDKKRDKRRG